MALRSRIFAVALRKFRKDCENFATIAKNLQSLRNFSMHSQKFAIIAKTTVHRENLNFRYASDFRYDSEIHYA